MGAPEPARGSFASVAAGLALILAAAALVVALTREPKAPTPSVARATVIAPGSIDASKIKPDTLTGAQIDESKLGPVPRSRLADVAGDARRFAGRRPSDFVAAARVVSSRLARASTGETKTVLKKSPFTVTMTCAQKPGNAVNVLLTAHSDRGSSVVAVAGHTLPPFGGGTKRDFQSITLPKAVWLSGQPFTLTAPSGQSVAGILSLGVKSFGSDCAAGVVAVG